MPRRQCEFPGCINLGRNKGHYKGSTRYDRFCERHHRRSTVGREAHYTKKQQIANTACERCGWDKAWCDRHRIDSQRGYFPENVEVLCPNCHRLAHKNHISPVPF